MRTEQNMNRTGRCLAMVVIGITVLPFGFCIPPITLGVETPITLKDMLSLRRVDGQMEISPDEQTLAYVVDDASGQNLWLLGIAEKPTTHIIGQGILPRWSPDGSRLAFYSTRSGTLQLWILDLKTNSALEITNIDGGISPNPRARFMGWSGDPLRYAWSPNGTKIVFTSQVELQGPAKGTEDRLTLPIGVFPGFSDTASSESSPLILTTRSPTYWALNGIFLTDSVRRFKGKSVAESDARSGRSPHLMTDELFIVDVETKTTEQLTKDDKEYFNPDWSPDGLEIAFASTSGKELIGYGPGNSNIYAINVGTRNVRPIATGIGEKRLPSWSPDGKWIAYSGGQHLRRLATYIVPSSGGTGLDITARLDRNVRTFYWAPDGKSIIITCDDGVSEPVIRLQVPNGEMQKVTRGEAYRWPLAVSHKGRIAWVQSDGEAAGLIYIADDNGNDLHILLDINPQIREWSIGKQEVVRWKNSKGELIEGILIKPVGYRRGKRYPVIVDPYSCRYNSFMAGPLGGNQAFASSGYAVFFPNHRSPHMASNLMKSEAYSRVARGPAGVDIMVDDIMSGISMLARKGIIDSKRMCLYGFSNGGGSVDLLVTKTMQFKCAVSASGVLSDWALTFFLTPMGSTVPYLAGGATPWQDPQAYIKLSPIYHLNNITTPMLLAVGDEDHDTLLSNVEMYYGLRYLNREVTLLRYPNQGHGFTGSALDDYWGRANAFLRFYLLSPGKNTK